MTPWSIRINKAMQVAATAHIGQIRKADGTPYIAHPFAVAWILSEHGVHEDVVIAGLLHDVLEDTIGYGAKDIVRDFGDVVLQYVREVSEDKDGTMTKEEERETWRERKEAYLVHLHTASEGSLCISAADKIHNLRSMVLQFQVSGIDMWEKFNSPQDKKMWFYEEVSRIISDRLRHPIALELADVVQQAKQIFCI